MESGRKVEKDGASEGETENGEIRIKRTPEREKEGQRATGAEGRDRGRDAGVARASNGATERAKIFWHFMSVIT